jgi:oligopeptide transport system permease protein
MGVIVINTMFTIPSAIFTEAFLSFIGIGLSEPRASLGVLINNGYQVLHNFPHLLIYPAIVIVLIMVCFIYWETASAMRLIRGCGNRS